MPPKGKGTRSVTEITQQRSTRAHPQGSQVALDFTARKRRATPEVNTSEYSRGPKRRRQETASNISDTGSHPEGKAESSQDEALTHSDTEHTHNEAQESPQDEIFAHSRINPLHSEALTEPNTENSDDEALESHQDEQYTLSDFNHPQSSALTHSDIEHTHHETLESPQEEAFTHYHGQIEDDSIESPVDETYAPYHEPSDDEAAEDPQDGTFTPSDIAKHPHNEISISISAAHSKFKETSSPQNETQRFINIEQSENVSANPYEFNNAHYDVSVLSDTESPHREASIFSGSKGHAFETDQYESSAVNDMESPQDEVSALDDIESPLQEVPMPAYTEGPEEETSFTDSFKSRVNKGMKRFQLDASFRENHLRLSNKSPDGSQDRRSSLLNVSHTEIQNVSRHDQTDTTKPTNSGIHREIPGFLLTKENIEQLERDQRNFHSLANLGRPRYDDRPPSIHDEDIFDNRYPLLRPARLEARRVAIRPPLAEEIQHPTTTVERLLPKKKYIEWNSESKAMFVVQGKESDGANSDGQGGSCMTNFITIYSPSISTSSFALRTRSLTDAAVIDAVSATLEWFEKNPQHPVPTASEMHELFEKFHQQKQAEMEPISDVQPEHRSRQTSQHDRKRRNRTQDDESDVGMMNREERLHRKAPKTPKNQQEPFRSVRRSPYSAREDVSHDKENQDSELENMETDVSSISKDDRASAQKRTLTAPQQNQPTSWASALSVSSIGNILRTPINFFTRRNRGAATDGRPGKATSAISKNQRPNHISQAPATIAHPKADRTVKARKSRESRANYGLQTQTPTHTYQFPTNGKPDGHLPLHLRGSTYDQLPPEWQAVSKHMKPLDREEPEPVDSRAGYTEEFKELLKLAEITRTDRLKKEAEEAEAKKKLQAFGSSLKRPYQAYIADETNVDRESVTGDVGYSQQTSGHSTYCFPTSSSDDDDESSDEESPLKEKGNRVEPTVRHGNEGSSKKPRLDPGLASHKQIGVVKDYTMMWGDDVPSQPEPPKAPFYATAPLGYPRDITPEEFGDPRRARPIDPTFLPGFRPYYEIPDPNLIRRKTREPDPNSNFDVRRATGQFLGVLPPSREATKVRGQLENLKRAREEASRELQSLVRAREEARRYVPKKPSPLWMTQNMSPEEKRKAWAGALKAGWGADITDPEVIDAVMAIPEDELPDYFADIGKENVAPVK